MSNNVRFVHDSVLGCTIGYIVDKNLVKGTAAFTCKHGPSAKGRKPDQFSRAKGREIVSGRLTKSNMLQIPYVFLIKASMEPTEVDNSIKGALNLIRSIHPDYDYKAVSSMAQIKNDAVIDAIYHSLYYKSKEKAHGRKEPATVTTW